MESARGRAYIITRVSDELERMGTPAEHQPLLGVSDFVRGLVADTKTTPGKQQNASRKPSRLAVIEACHKAISSECYSALLASWLYAHLGSSECPEGVGLRATAIATALQDEEAEWARDRRTLGELEKELRPSLLALLKSAGIGPELPPDEGLPSSGDLFSWDASLEAHTRKIGERGKEYADKVRSHGSELFAAYKRGESSAWDVMFLWLPLQDGAAPRVLIALTKLLLHGRVIARLRKPPALAMAVYAPVLGLLSPSSRVEKKDGRSVVQFAGVEGHARIARVPEHPTVGADAINVLTADKGIDLFRSLTAHRLLRWQVVTAHAQALAEMKDPRTILVEGGYTALAHEHLGLKSNQAIEEVRAIIEAEHSLEIQLPPVGDYSRLLIRRFLPPTKGRRSQLELVLGTALLPNYVNELKKSRVTGMPIRLVPVLDLPPLVGREREHGAQASFSMAIIVEMRSQAREMAQMGGAVLDEATLARLARRVGLPIDLITRVIDRWTRDGDDGPAFLKRIDLDRYTVGDAHAWARRFLEQGGHDMIVGSKAGQKSVAARHDKIHRLSKNKGTKR